MFGGLYCCLLAVWSGYLIVPSSLSEDDLAALAEYQRRVAAAKVAERARASFYEFFKESWHVLEQSTPYLDNWHIKSVCNALQLVF